MLYLGLLTLIFWRLPFFPPSYNHTPEFDKNLGFWQCHMVQHTNKASQISSLMFKSKEENLSKFLILKNTSFYHHSILFVINVEEQSYTNRICPSEFDISTQEKSNFNSSQFGHESRSSKISCKLAYSEELGITVNQQFETLVRFVKKTSLEFSEMLRYNVILKSFQSTQ